MKLDRTRPYGHTYGHPFAVYQQDGHLFDGAGVSVEETKVTPAPQAEEPLATDETKERAFLISMLGEGPVRKEALYKECQVQNLSWETVAKEASEMDIYSFEQGVGKNRKEMWKLGQD